MSSETDKLTGLKNKVVGAAKMGVGDAVGNPDLKAEGVTQNAVGKAQEAVGKAKDAVKKVIDNA